jgi:hypothetical protein
VVPLLNHVKLSGPYVAKVLDPGESLLAIGLYRPTLNGDDSRLALGDQELSGREQSHLRETGERLPRSDRFFQGIDWRGVHVNPRRVNRLLFGLDGDGEADSTAGQMWRAARRPAKGLRHWAVTDRRLLLLRDTFDQDHTWQVLFAVPRPAVRSARRRGKFLLQWGRVEIGFEDGSMLAFLTGFLDMGAARHLVRAINNTSGA